MANAAVEMQKIAANAQIQAQKLSNEATEKSFKYNTAEANAARQWQTEMSNTSHQREVKDLIAAGLNPVLSSGGSGAQSYTTSSANAQAENAANAVTQLATSRMSGLAGIEQANISAAATRSAAAQSAAAMKAAAAAQAGAARYAASMQYLTQKYQSDKAYAATKYSSDTSRDIAFNGPTGNPIKMIDKYFGSSAAAQGKSSFLSNLKSVVAPSVKDVQKNPQRYFYANENNKPITAKNFSLNPAGVRIARNALQKLGMSMKSSNINLYAKAYYFGDPTALKTFTSRYLNSKTSHTVALSRLNNAFVLRAFH